MRLKVLGKYMSILQINKSANETFNQFKKRGKYMVYENLKLVVAAISGDIFLTKASDGIMDVDSRRLVTDEVLSAATEWFRANNHKAINFSGLDNNVHNLFYTSDPEKAEKIKAILKDEN